MAQGQLLYVVKQIWGKRPGIRWCLICLILILGLNNQALALKDQGQEWVKEVVKNTGEEAMEGIRDKYLELQKLLGILDHEESEELTQGVLTTKPILRIFVSSSMSKELLKSYVHEAKNYQAVLVFKGLPNGSWQELSGLVSYITDDIEEIAIQIDDEAFDRFAVTSVPTFVLSKDDREFWHQDKIEVFDKVTGNIGIKAALAMMARGGDLANDANKILEER